MRLLSRPTCLLVLFALLVVGCAGSRLPSVEPDSLRQVNRVLDGRWARIQKTNGALIEHPKDVRVGADSTTFYHRLEQRQGAIPTDSVSKVASYAEMLDENEDSSLGQRQGSHLRP
jgi:hypothetical protein